MLGLSIVHFMNWLNYWIKFSQEHMPLVLFLCRLVSKTWLVKNGLMRNDFSYVIFPWELSVRRWNHFYFVYDEISVRVRDLVHECCQTWVKHKGSKFILIQIWIYSNVSRLTCVFILKINLDTHTERRIQLYLGTYIIANGFRSRYRYIEVIQLQIYIHFGRLKYIWVYYYCIIIMT